MSNDSYLEAKGREKDCEFQMMTFFVLQLLNNMNNPHNVDRHTSS